MVRRNAELLKGIGADAQLRSESSRGSADVISAHLSSIEDLRGLWPFSSVGPSRQVYDLSGQGWDLNVGGGAEGISPWGLINYGRCDTTTYWYHTDTAALSLTGSMAMGCWFRLDELPGSGVFRALMGKFKIAALERSYLLAYWNTAGVVSIGSIVSDDGTNEHYATMYDAPLYEGRWHCAGMRFEPSTVHQVWLDGRMAANNSSVPASIKDTAIRFGVGGYDVGSAILDGDVTMAWIAGSDVSEVIMRYLYHTARPVFGREHERR